MATEHDRVLSQTQSTKQYAVAIYGCHD